MKKKIHYLENGKTLCGRQKSNLLTTESATLFLGWGEGKCDKCYDRARERLGISHTPKPIYN